MHCLPSLESQVGCRTKGKMQFLKKNVNLCTEEKCYLKWKDLDTELASGFRPSSSSVGALWLWCPMVQIINQRHAFHWFHGDKSKCLCLWAFPRIREIQTLTHTKPTCFWQIPKHSELWNFLCYNIGWRDLCFRLTVSSMDQCRSFCCILKGGEQSQDKRSLWPISHDNFHTTERGF